MKLTVFEWPYRPFYYLTHPWKWLSTLFYNIRDASQRAHRGYCRSDVFDMDHWLLAILPLMLRDMANSKVGAYPGIEPFETPEKWHDWLYSIAGRISALQTDWAETRNEYDEEYFEAISHARKTKRNENGCLVYSYDDDETIKELRDKWANRVKELNEEQKKETIEVFTEIATHLYALWL